MFADPARARHAAKVGLALVLVYLLTLQWGWINPFWAGFAVIFCSLMTQGESLNKMMLRIWGTLIGTAAALTIMALFGQDRWTFMAACCVYMSVMTYLLTGQRASYMWQVSGFVMLAIIPSYSSDTNYLFQIAMARMEETILGCCIWALIDMLIWPVTNVDALKKTAAQLMDVQQKLVRLCGECTLKAEPVAAGQEEFTELRGQQVQLIAALKKTLQAAGSESYQVREHRAEWDKLAVDADALLSEVDQWHSGLNELEHIELDSLVPGSSGFIDAIQQQIAVGQVGWSGDTLTAPELPADLNVKSSDLTQLRHFDRAAVLVTLVHLRRIAGLAAELCYASQQINGIGELTAPAAPAKGGRPKFLFVPDRDRLRSSVYMIFLICTCFLIWIYVDPPGHRKIWTVTAIFGVIAATLPFARIGSVLLKVFAIVLPVGGLIHIFVMPALSGYHELGLLIFAFIFAAQYWLKNPLAVMLASVGFLLMTGIDNQQSYSFIGIALAYLFVLLSLLLLICCSYVLGSPRPEKKLLILMHRYFSSAEFVLKSAADDRRSLFGFLSRWRLAFHLQELATLPAKMRQWSSQINQQNFPANSPEQVAAMIGQLDGLRYRLLALQKLRGQLPDRPMADSLQVSVDDWGGAMRAVFARFARTDFSESAGQLTEKVNRRLQRIEDILTELMEADGSLQFGDDDRTNAYLLLGVYRGVAAAALAWAAQAETMDWNNWRQECFS